MQKLRWEAGGDVSLPLVPRLLARTRACVAGAKALVLFVSSPGSRGSFFAAGEAVKRGERVFVFCCGKFGGKDLGRLAGVGHWLPVFGGPLDGAWEWVTPKKSLNEKTVHEYVGSEQFAADVYSQ